MGINHGKFSILWGFYSSHSTEFFIKKDAANLLDNMMTYQVQIFSRLRLLLRMIVKHKLLV